MMLKKGTLAVMAAALLVAGATGAIAGKRDGASCRGDRQCNSRICEIAPGAKAGTCCVRDTCESLDGCGTMSDGCAGEVDCGGCSGGFDCVANTCDPTSICGWPVIFEFYPAGSYADTCYGCDISQACSMNCFCRDSSNVSWSTSLQIDACDPATQDIANVEGTLTCLDKI